MASNMFLYWGSGSIPCWKPMIVLEEKGLKDYGQKLISFSNKENKSEEIMKLNPRGQVPTFRDGDLVINESSAICEYLEFKFADQGTQLLPTDIAVRAKVLQRMHETVNLQKKLLENIVYYHFTTKPEDIDKEHLDAKKKEAREELQLWEDYLKKEGDKACVVGTDFTMADVYFFPFLAWGVRGHLNITAFPALSAYYKRLEQRPSIQASWPPHWKDGASKDFFGGV